jgi:hypothetical protein
VLNDSQQDIAVADCRIGSRSRDASTRASMMQLDWRFTGALMVLTVTLATVFARWTASSWWGFPAFLVAVWAFCYLPGAALLPRQEETTALERVSLRLIFGMAATLALYSLLRRAGLAGAFWLWPIGSLIAIAVRSRPLVWPSLRWDGRVAPVCWLLLALVVAELALLAHVPGYFSNFVRYGDGSMSFDVWSADSLLHTALARELTHAIPPGAPFLSGEVVVYHFAMDLMAAMTANVASLSVLDATVRFVPTFFAVLVPLAIAAFSGRFLRSPYAGALVAFLVMFAEDLSYIPGLWLAPPGPWATIFFGMTTTLSLYFLNPVLPALGVLFGALLCLSLYLETSRTVWVWCAALLLGVLTDYKVFTAVHAALALGVAGVVYAVRWRDFTMFKAAAAAGVCLAPLVLHQWLTSRVTAVEWIYGPWPYVQEMYRMFGWAPPATAGVLLVGLPLYLFLTFGIRMLGLPDVVRTLVRIDRHAPLRYLLATLVVAGPAVSLLTRVVERGYPVAEQYNNAAWFLGLSKHVIWLFAVDAVWAWGVRRPVAALRTAVCAVVLLSLPSTVQLWRWIGTLQQLRISQPEVATIDWLDRACAPGDVVFAREDFAARVVTLTRCHVTFGRAFRPLVTRETLEARMADVAQFWTAWQAGTERIDILERYGTRFVVAGERWKDPVGDGARPSGSGRLTVRYTSGDLIVLEVLPAATASARAPGRSSGG